MIFPPRSMMLPTLPLWLSFQKLLVEVELTSGMATAACAAVDNCFVEIQCSQSRGTRLSRSVSSQS